MPATRSLAERSRKPTGLPSSPAILVSGEDFSGKTVESVLLTASDKVGPSWLTQLGEIDGDAYGAIVDSKGRKVHYDLVETDGTWPDIMTTIAQVNEAATAHVAEHGTDKPPVHIFDSTTIEWELLSTWANNRARSSDKAKKILADDPNADIDVGRIYWNAANRRHNQFMAELLRFPGIVIMTARGKWVSPTDKRTGQPVQGAAKEYTLEAHKHIGFRSTVWVRLSREEKPTIVGARRANGGVRPGDRPLVVDGRRNPDFRNVDFSLEWLIFDWLGYNPAAATPRQLNEPVPGDEPDLADIAEAMGISLRCAELRRAIADAGSGDGLRAVWKDIATAVKTQEIPVAEGEALRGEYRDRAMVLGRANAEKDTATDGKAAETKTNEPKTPQVAA